MNKNDQAGASTAALRSAAIGVVALPPALGRMVEKARSSNSLSRSGRASIVEPPSMDIASSSRVLFGVDVPLYAGPLAPVAGFPFTGTAPFARPRLAVKHG